MKPFNLSDALAGKPVVTRDGREVTEIYCFKTSKVGYPLSAVVNGDILYYTVDGKYDSGDRSGLDLFMKSKRVEKYMNIFMREDNIPYATGVLYNSEDEAKKCSRFSIAIVPVTFEV